MSFFWSVSAVVNETSERKTFLVHSPYNKKKTREILLEVHPEYSKLSLRKASRPPQYTLWGENSND